MTARHHFSFAGNVYARTVAHGGRGEITFARIRDHRPASGCKWIDMSILPPGSSIGLHTHSLEDEEVYVVISGRGRMIVEGDEFFVEAGDVIVNPPGGTHALENIGDHELRLVVVDICHQPESPT